MLVIAGGESEEDNRIFYIYIISKQCTVANRACNSKESHRKFSLVLTKNHLILLDENNKLQSYTRCQETISPKIEHL